MLPVITEFIDVRGPMLPLLTDSIGEEPYVTIDD